MSNKIQQKNSKTKNLELDVKEKELEYEAIKEAIEKGNINLLQNFNLKGFKYSKYSAKIPKKLSEKQKEKREEIRRLKEAEDLAQIQQKLFRQAKGKRKIEPLYNKKSMYSNKDVFGANLEKECEKILVKDEKHNKNKKFDTYKSYNGNTNKDNGVMKKYKIDCEKNIKETDEEKDKEFLDELDKDIKNFYIEKCGEIFYFLKDINLCRYIDEFLKRGFDLYEEFIEIKEDFFKKMQSPFLNEIQQKKFFNKLHEIKSNNNDKNNNQFNQFNNNQQKNDNKEQIYANKLNIPNGKINQENINNISSPQSDELNINNIIEKAQKLADINIQTSPQNINQKIIKDTSSKISPEELMYKTSHDIDYIEQKRSEEFKKAVENWRNNNINSRPNTSSLPVKNKMTEEIGININQPFKQKIMSYCWNCYKKFVKEEGVSKEYFNDFQLNEKYNMKNFCSLKCNKDYEKKQRSQFMCFECKKMCNIMNGFIAYEGNKFCSNICKNKYIEEENCLNNQNKKNRKTKNKKDKEKNTNEIIVNELLNEKNKEEKENKNHEENNAESNIEKEEEEYDPMNDF